MLSSKLCKTACQSNANQNCKKMTVVVINLFNITEYQYLHPLQNHQQMADHLTNQTHELDSQL